MKSKTAFTLIEVMIVLVIIGVLSSLAMMSFSGSMEKAAEREACINLESIISAINIYKINNGSYPAKSLVDTSAHINSNLKMDLPVSAPRWGYEVKPFSLWSPERCVHAKRLKTGSTLVLKLCTNPTLTGQACSK
jgi:prepilin-type N-terminal cleavage/methylation domain-containing protein